MNNKVTPLSPDEVSGIKSQRIPDEVIAIFNELILEKWNGHYAMIKQKDVVAAIRHKMEVSSEHIYKSSWLDVECLFQNAGWVVIYDKPGYNEDYSATFEFRKQNEQNNCE